MWVGCGWGLGGIIKKILKEIPYGEYLKSSKNILLLREIPYWGYLKSSEEILLLREINYGEFM